MKKERKKRCYICNAIHNRRSRYCSKRCEWWDKKNFKECVGGKEND